MSAWGVLPNTAVLNPRNRLLCPQVIRALVECARGKPLVRLLLATAHRHNLGRTGTLHPRGSLPPRPPVVSRYLPISLTNECQAQRQRAEDRGCDRTRGSPEQRSRAPALGGMSADERHGDIHQR